MVEGQGVSDKLLGDVNSGPGTGTCNLCYLRIVNFEGQVSLSCKMRHWMVLEVSSVSDILIPRDSHSSQ